MTPQPDFSTTRRPSRRRPWEPAALGLGALAFAFVAGSAWYVRGQAREAEARLSEVRREVASLAGRKRAFPARTQAQPGALAGGSSSPARVVAAVASALPPDVRLERLTIDYVRDVAVQMQVEARSAAAWDRLLDRLERSPEFREVEPGPESRDGEVRSRVDARFVGGAGR